MTIQKALQFQFIVVIVGMALGTLFGLLPITTWLQQDAPTPSLHWVGKGLGYSTGLGLAAGLTMFGVIFLISQWQLPWFRQIESLLEQHLLNLLREASAGQRMLLCLLAGVGEELLFRWAIQGGIERWGSESLAPADLWALGCGISAAIFGLAHPITRAYILLAGLIGILMSALVVSGGGIWSAIVAHGFYDWLALTWLLQTQTDSKQ